MLCREQLNLRQRLDAVNCETTRSSSSKYLKHDAHRKLNLSRCAAVGGSNRLPLTCRCTSLLHRPLAYWTQAVCIGRRLSVCFEMSWNQMMSSSLVSGIESGTGVGRQQHRYLHMLPAEDDLDAKKSCIPPKSNNLITAGTLVNARSPYCQTACRLHYCGLDETMLGGLQAQNSTRPITKTVAAAVTLGTSASLGPEVSCCPLNIRQQATYHCLDHYGSLYGSMRPWGRCLCGSRGKLSLTSTGMRWSKGHD